MRRFYAVRSDEAVNTFSRYRLWSLQSFYANILPLRVELRLILTELIVDTRIEMKKV